MHLVLLWLHGLLANCSFCCFDKSQQVAERFPAGCVVTIIYLRITLFLGRLIYYPIHILSSSEQLPLLTPEQVEVYFPATEIGLRGCYFSFSLLDLTTNLQMVFLFLCVPHLSGLDMLVIHRSSNISFFPPMSLSPQHWCQD